MLDNWEPSITTWSSHGLYWWPSSNKVIQLIYRHGWFSKQELPLCTEECKSALTNKSIMPILTLVWNQNSWNMHNPGGMEGN